MFLEESTPQIRLSIQACFISLSLICKITSACLHLFPVSTFVLRLVGVLLSFVCGRLRGGLRRATHGLPCRAPVCRGCPCQDPSVCHRVQGDSVAKRQPSLCVVGVVTSCVPCARARTSCSCATENTYTPARLEALFKLSVRQFINSCLFCSSNKLFSIPDRERILVPRRGLHADDAISVLREVSFNTVFARYHFSSRL